MMIKDAQLRCPVSLSISKREAVPGIAGVASHQATTCGARPASLDICLDLLQVSLVRPDRGAASIYSRKKCDIINT